MSLIKMGLVDSQIKKQNRFYLRYYHTIIKARKLNAEIYGDKMSKGNLQLKIQHPLRVASLTEEIKNQTISDYHMTWLVGLLHDSKQDNLLLYTQMIGEIIEDLFPEEKKKVLCYIDQLTSDQWLPKGKKKEDQLKKMQILDIIPCWIRIFDKYDNCKRFRKNSVGKSKKEIDGYCAVAYLCYLKGIQRYEQINKNLQQKIRDFYEIMGEQLGGIQKMKALANQYFNIDN